MQEAVTSANVDLSNCDRELVHMPGLIQPHGVMLVLDPGDLAIVQASENTAPVFGVSALDLVGRKLADLVGTALGDVLCREIRHAGERLQGGPVPLVLRVPDASGGCGFDALAHRSGAVVILELERAVPDATSAGELHVDLAACVGQLQTAPGLQPFLEVAVTEVRALTGFDRVMAYRFADDGSGHVVAEARRADLRGYLGHHFPASDIPEPARRLFALSWLRHLPDVDYTPVRLLPQTGVPVDMSRAILRHVSVMYSSYLKNMRARSTMVLPLMKAGRLWGLICCMHHASPLHVPSRTRTAIEILAHMVSLLMSEQEDRDTADYRSRLRTAIKDTARQMQGSASYHASLSAGAATLRGALEASGAAFVMDHAMIRFGDTPAEDEIRGLAAWLGEQHDTMHLFSTDRLSHLFPPASRYRHSASGVLAARLLRNQAEFLMWFRPEIVQTIDWAGDPAKPVQVDVADGQARLTPRASFDTWRQTVSGRAAPWLACETEAADTVRRLVAQAALVELNQDIRRSNQELDSFAYVASHDLKEPLRGINNYAQFFGRSAGPKLTEDERSRLETIFRLTRRMDDLTDALLGYARISWVTLAPERIAVDALLLDIVDTCWPGLAQSGTSVSLLLPLPQVKADRARLTEVFRNLISNAITYNDRQAGDRRIEIGCRVADERPVFFVRDNGIGIAQQNLEPIFEIFRRLHGRDTYGGGVGAGLTIARRSVERLGGRLWAESEGLGRGATFLFTLGWSVPKVAAP